MTTYWGWRIPRDQDPEARARSFGIVQFCIYPIDRVDPFYEMGLVKPDHVLWVCSSKDNPKALIEKLGEPTWSRTGNAFPKKFLTSQWNPHLTQG